MCRRVLSLSLAVQYYQCAPFCPIGNLMKESSHLVSFDFSESHMSGRLRSADVNAAIAAVSSPGGEQVLDALFEYVVSSPKLRVASNSAWVLSHLPSRYRPWLSERRGRLADALLSSSDDTLRRILVTILANLDWAAEDLRSDLIDFALDNITNLHVPLGVRAQSLYLAHKMCATVPELAAEFRLVRSLLAEEADLPPGLRAAVRRTGCK